LNALGGEPVGVWLPRRDFALEHIVAQHDAAPGVDRDHLAGTEPALLDNGRLIDLDRPCLGARDEQSVVRDCIAQRTQPIAVERGAGDDAVAKAECGRTIPLLYQTGMEIVEGPPCGIHLRQLLPWLGYQHHQRVRKRPASVVEKTHDIIETERVAPFPGDHRLKFVQRRAVRELELWRPRLHPEPVAADGIYLAVVRQEAERLGHPPGGERVGRIALVEEDNRALVAHILQVQVEQRQVPREAEGFVDQRPRGAGGDEELWPARELGGTIDGLARQEQLTLEVVLRHAVGTADEELLDARHGADGLVAERIRIRGDGPPGDRLQTASANCLSQSLAGSICLPFVFGKECHGHGQLARV
jgi:hypothetical protein